MLQTRQFVMRQRPVCELQGERIVSLYMLVVLREFLQSIDTVWISATRQLRQQMKRNFGTLQPLLQPCYVPQSSIDQLIRQSGIYCLAHQLKAALIVLCRNQPPADAQKLFTAPQAECTQ